MRALVVGAGGVGSAIAAVAAKRDLDVAMTVTDIDPARANRAVERFDDRFTSGALDASDAASVAQAAADLGADVVLNACDPRFNEPIFQAAFDAGCTYLDMAMTLSQPHPERPYEATGVTLGQTQFAAGARWEERGLLALVGIGVEPGM
ncbi:MAG TPA: saccharopine dehydrogenase NADP-binding domain-containing protein, partial [Actinomycetota bacterium]|nr:saccharopine dehydrogenase NADP-binding domain-containing protein [Actinomycetota bacterium]